ncbi:hypothetical protein SAMN04488033_11190 [Salegentibacter agarivorans]|uniref:Uncharacterized protein n=1 Tax=Salegentibacter agarivorans TaxID=345907 RepID=A0A1I2M3Z2_9FLAO|nr:hypothetical protein [Salegentibacter agarivorans]SFF85479.1 hypothetical protein SAMN04488033_11190 [Salegentibacter agarivorans]
MANNINVVHYARIMRVDVRNNYSKYILVLILLFFSQVVLGQNPPEPSPTAIPPPPGLPIDFGISALIAAGLALGIHHIKNRK